MFLLCVYPYKTGQYYFYNCISYSPYKAGLYYIYDYVSFSPNKVFTSAMFCVRIKPVFITIMFSVHKKRPLI